MNMDGNERERTLTGRLCERRVSREISGDFVIPDSQPEARRVLAVTERVLPPAKYVGASSVECNGTVDYRVLYLGVDGELWGACFSSEYELEAPIEEGEADISGGTSSLVSIRCDGSTARLNAGRRLNLKSRLFADIRAYGEIDSGLSYKDGDETVQMRYQRTKCGRLVSGSSDAIELSEEVSGLYADSRVISAESLAYVNDLRKGSDQLVASGEVTVKLLVCREGQRAETLTKKIPFEGTVEFGEPIGGADCRAECAVTDLAVNVGEGSALCTLSAVITAVAAENADVSYVSDAYALDRECECERVEALSPTVALCSSGNFSQSERIALSDTEIPEGARLVDMWGRVSFDGCEYNGRYELSGKSRYAFLWEKEGDYGVAELELPVRYIAEGDAVTEPVPFVSADIISCRGRIDGELVRIDAEIGVSADVVGSESVSFVGDLRFGEPLDKEKNRMVVYYPTPDETPWDVAKKYHVPADSLAEEKNYYLF